MRAATRAAVEPRPILEDLDGDNPERSGMRRAVRRPRRLGRYLVSESIAHGGMASVHLAVVDEDPGRVYALKRIHPHLANDEYFTHMLLDENAIGAAIQHPNVIATYGGERCDGEMLLVMEYVAGASLAELGRACNGPMPPRYAAAIVAGALRGLHAAHEALDSRGHSLGIVHRDVSPQNVMVGIDGVPRIFDFGIATATRRLQSTRAGTLKGKLAYMAPEQVLQTSCDRRVDVYAAGVVLWEALTGQDLFQERNDAATLARLLENDIVRPSLVHEEIPRAIDAIVMCALAKDPDRRYGTALEMAEALERVLCRQPVSAMELGGWVSQLAELQLARQEQIRHTLQAPPSPRRSHVAPATLAPPRFRVENEPAAPSSFIDVALVLALVLSSGLAGALAMQLLHHQL